MSGVVEDVRFRLHKQEAYNQWTRTHGFLVSYTEQQYADDVKALLGEIDGCSVCDRINQMQPLKWPASREIILSYLGRVLNHWDNRDMGPNWPEIIAACNGWTPLAPGREMTVHHGGGEFIIKRVS